MPDDTPVRDLMGELLQGARDRFDDGGEGRCERVSTAQRELLRWLAHFQDAAPSRNAVELLDGTRAALLEAATYVGIGLGRAAVTSIRTQVDLLLAYTYFVDHPREWGRLSERDEGFMLRAELRRYHEGLFPGFARRLGIVEQAAGAGLIETYRTLSAHVHAQSTFTVPTAARPAELLASEEFLDSVMDIQQQTADRLSEYLVALYALSWQDLPRDPVERVGAMLTEGQRATLFPRAGT